MTSFNPSLFISQLGLEGLSGNRAETGILDQRAEIDQLTEQLDEILNHGIELQNNLKGELLELTLDEGENEIHHGMTTTPMGYLVLYKEKEGDVFGSRVSEWTTEVLFLKSSVPSLKVRLFVL